MPISSFNVARLPLPLLLLVGWAALNALQISLTELFHDEAYYWTWSHDLRWGYAEHPPMVAFVIAIGQSLLPGEWGVRLLPWLLHLLSLRFIWQMTGEEDIRTFAWVGVSLIGLHVAGFMAVPDSPYLFFISWFFLRYQRFLERDSLSNVLWLTLAVAGVLYSKYHGMMVIGMVLLSHLSLLRKGKFWLVVLGAAVLLAPLLMWLIEESFATFRFHLGNRVPKEPDWTFVANFLGGQIGLMGPILASFGLVAAWRTSAADPFTRALKYSFWGVLTFLLLMSFRTWIEANWSAGALIPLYILTVRWLAPRQRFHKWVKGLGAFALVASLIIRAYLMGDFLTPLGLSSFKDDVHGWQDWAEQVHEVAGDTPVVFLNSYARPSKYAFYAHQPPYAVNTLTYHPTQYDHMPLGEDLRGKTVYLAGGGAFPGAEKIETSAEALYLRAIPNFQPLRELQLHPVTPFPQTARPGDTLQMTLRLDHGYPHPLDLNANSDHPPRIMGYVREWGKFVAVTPLSPRLTFTLADPWVTEVSLPLPEKAGRYQIAFALQPAGLYIEYATLSGYVEVGNP